MLITTAAIYSWYSKAQLRILRIKHTIIMHSLAHPICKPVDVVARITATSLSYHAHTYIDALQCPAESRYLGMYVKCYSLSTKQRRKERKYIVWATCHRLDNPLAHSKGLHLLKCIIPQCCAMPLKTADLRGWPGQSKHVTMLLSYTRSTQLTSYASYPRILPLQGRLCARNQQVFCNICIHPSYLHYHHGRFWCTSVV